MRRVNEAFQGFTDRFLSDYEPTKAVCRDKQCEALVNIKKIVGGGGQPPVRTDANVKAAIKKSAKKWAARDAKAAAEAAKKNSQKNPCRDKSLQGSGFSL